MIPNLKQQLTKYNQSFVCFFIKKVYVVQLSFCYKDYCLFLCNSIYCIMILKEKSSLYDCIKSRDSLFSFRERHMIQYIYREIHVVASLFYLININAIQQHHKLQPPKWSYSLFIFRIFMKVGFIMCIYITSVYSIKPRRTWFP